MGQECDAAIKRPAPRRGKRRLAFADGHKMKWADGEGARAGWERRPSPGRPSLPPPLSAATRQSRQPPRSLPPEQPRLEAGPRPIQSNHWTGLLGLPPPGPNWPMG